MTKTVIKKVFGRANISLKALQILVIEVETVLNDRPITYISLDVTDLEPLTPSHLLYGRRITSLPYSSVEDDEMKDPEFLDNSEVSKRAILQTLRLRHFGSRWKREYLTYLRESRKQRALNSIW